MLSFAVEFLSIIGTFLVHTSTKTGYMYIYTIWLFNMAMENPL